MKKLALTVFFDSFALMMLGLILVMSASSTYSVFKFDSVFYLFNFHLFKVIFGIFLIIAFSFIPYEIYRKFSKPAIFLTVFLLFITLMVAPNIKGAGRWLNLGFTSIQPAAIALLTLIIHLAVLLEDKSDLIDNYRHGFLYLFIWVIVVSGLIMLQPNISSGIMIIIISLIIIYAGGGKLKHILISLLISSAAVAALAMVFPHSRARILSFISSFFSSSELNFQVKQALYSLGSGGLFGVGIGNSMQNNLFLPEAYGDFIFAILGEETGLIGSLFVLVSYLILFAAGTLIAKKATDKFGQLLAFGITVSIILYAYVNVAVTTGILPTTGLPLPFISYGGTSLIFLCISVGILINIALSHHIKQKSNIEVSSNYDNKMEIL